MSEKLRWDDRLGYVNDELSLRKELMYSFRDNDKDKVIKFVDSARKSGLYDAVIPNMADEIIVKGNLRIYLMFKAANVTPEITSIEWLCAKKLEHAKEMLIDICNSFPDLSFALKNKRTGLTFSFACKYQDLETIQALYNRVLLDIEKAPNKEKFTKSFFTVMLSTSLLEAIQGDNVDALSFVEDKFEEHGLSKELKFAYEKNAYKLASNKKAREIIKYLLKNGHSADNFDFEKLIKKSHSIKSYNEFIDSAGDSGSGHVLYMACKNKKEKLVLEYIHDRGITPSYDNDEHIILIVDSYLAILGEDPVSFLSHERCNDAWRKLILKRLAM